MIILIIAFFSNRTLTDKFYVWQVNLLRSIEDGRVLRSDQITPRPRRPRSNSAPFFKSWNGGLAHRSHALSLSSRVNGSPRHINTATIAEQVHQSYQLLETKTYSQIAARFFAQHEGCWITRSESGFDLTKFNDRHSSLLQCSPQLWPWSPSTTPRNRPIPLIQSRPNTLLPRLTRNLMIT